LAHPQQGLEAWYQLPLVLEIALLHLVLVLHQVVVRLQQ
jgi:hypothetical protein